ncbi:MAG: hypothetical protein P1V51_15605 [Deltaproteobacteria bacterium]|nr:hypothetical protein [Deltaproteobacteria bacterium]
MKSITKIFAGAMALFLAAAAAPAGADCLEGTRKTSAAERAVHQKVGAVLDKAFPAPEGWKQASKRPHRVPGSVCKNSTGERLNATFRVSYLEVGGADKRNEKMKAEMMAMAAGGPGDAEAMKAKMEAMKKMTQDLHRDTMVEVEAHVNQIQVLSPGYPVEIAGGYLALQAVEAGDIPDQRRTTVLFGEWSQTDEGDWVAKTDPKASPETVQTATVIVRATPERTLSYLASADLKSIAALVQAAK